MPEEGANGCPWPSCISLLLDRLAQIPAHQQENSNMFDGRSLRQLDNVAVNGFDSSASRSWLVRRLLHFPDYLPGLRKTACFRLRVDLPVIHNDIEDAI